ncbi:ubiquitin carboxyl-terminal hydrolase 1 [Lepisosteus oculatus]|uniref:Ubiquitin carboxyl-terminal hydrolase n=1 Tax=Lepisosteus oculatus TaxID=7918 RepID=W5MHQ6_LEPOC|nr:PREDICTED: ubiquitin carboxyl-terminal hydrolase 1 [Lepisosteus oculatus]
MPGLVQNEGNGAASGSPLKKNRLSLKFFQKKETKRALNFSEAQEEEEDKPSEPPETESCDQVVPVPNPSSPLTCEKKERLVPFVGLNNLGNTCYLNSILQVLYYCPGFKDGIKKLYNLLSKKNEKQKDDGAKTEEKQEQSEEALPVNIELLSSFHSLIVSLEQLQSSYLLNPEKYTDGELAAPPRRLLNTLRQLNPMYEGYLQHDAQEVLQCILGYIQEACETIKKEYLSHEDPADKPTEMHQKHMAEKEEIISSTAPKVSIRETENALKDAKNLEQDRILEGQANGKRKSDTEVGNAKKKSKTHKTQKPVEENKHFTRSKRKSSSDIVIESHMEEVKEEGNDSDDKKDNVSKGIAKKKKRPKLNWLKSSGKQPSIFSKFRSMGRRSLHSGGKEEVKPPVGNGPCLALVEHEDVKDDTASDHPVDNLLHEKQKTKSEGECCFDLMERLFQGQLVLRTRCLECECYTERREDFQDISVPVQEDEPSKVDSSTEISPDPKMELKTLKWAISQFASVERIVGEDKYFCETCHHYTEAERSLLFDKTPEVITIHLKCFAANSSEFDPYAGLSKVNTPLQTPLKLSLDEWCTKPSKEDYELFAVVMHSGVTISSGHYTTYIKMMDLKNVKLQNKVHIEEDLKPEPLNEAEARACDIQEYDDGEVSFGKSGKGHSTATGKVSTKKSSEGIGLLGGQRSITSFELGGNKAANSEKPICATGNNGKMDHGCASGYESAIKSEKESADANSTCNELLDAKSPLADSAFCNVLDYEGKWMLFDDSEVRLVDEKDFLSACSPESCTTSTPYLLFYKKVI